MRANPSTQRSSGVRQRRPWRRRLHREEHHRQLAAPWRQGHALRGRHPRATRRPLAPDCRGREHLRGAGPERRLLPDLPRGGRLRRHFSPVSSPAPRRRQPVARSAGRASLGRDANYWHFPATFRRTSSGGPGAQRPPERFARETGSSSSRRASREGSRAPRETRIVEARREGAEAHREEEGETFDYPSRLAARIVDYARAGISRTSLTSEDRPHSSPINVTSVHRNVRNTGLTPSPRYP